MPVLKEYADSNRDKDGYFVHAPISGSSHPIPLQTPEVTEKIYRRIGYKPTKKGRDGGVHVPNDLTWSLYDVGLHWTEKSGPQGNPSDLDPTVLRDTVGPDLTANDLEKILEFTDNYQGQYQSRVEDLKEMFSDESNENSSESSSSSLEKMFQEVSDNPSLPDEVEDKLDVWEPDTIKDNDYNPDDDSGFLSQLHTSRSDYREALSLIPNLKTRIQEYENHPWEVKYVKATNGNTSSNSNGLSITFRTERRPELNKWSIKDYRGIEDSRDFIVSTGIKDRIYTFEVEEGFISDFDITVTHKHVGKFDIPPEDSWVYEIDEENPNELFHALIADFHHLISVIEEFFDGITSFNLESMNPEDYSVYLG